MVESTEELIAGLKNEKIYNSDRLSNILFLLCSVTGEQTPENMKVFKIMSKHINKLFLEHVKINGNDAGSKN